MKPTLLPLALAVMILIQVVALNGAYLKHLEDKAAQRQSYHHGIESGWMAHRDGYSLDEFQAAASNVIERDGYYK